MGFKSEILALAFGMLLIFLTFGDDHLAPNIGNLDTIFGLRYWPVLDVIYPVASILIFLLYGFVKGGGLKLKITTVSFFVSYLVALLVISSDDIATVLNIQFSMSQFHWSVIMWVYPIYSSVAFFLFGKANQH
jgi:hypothetical protein